MPAQETSRAPYAHTVPKFNDLKMKRTLNPRSLWRMGNMVHVLGH